MGLVHVMSSRFPSGIRPAESASSSKPRRYVHALRKCTAQHRIVRSEAASFTEETTKAANPLRIVFVSAEVGPWSKTGGLGDVVGGLPIALAQRGHNVLTIAPRYDQYADAWDTSVTRNIDGQEVRYFHTKKNGVDRVWIDNDAFLAKVWGKTGGKLYGQRSGSDYSDNQKRFVLFNKAAIEALTALPFSPGEDCVVVANDWHTAMFPVLLKDQYQPNGQFSKTKVAFCVHNIAYQGRFWEEQFESLQVPSASKSKFAFEDGNPRVYDETEPDTADKPVLGDKGRKYKKVNWMKAAFLSADKLLTVSPTYATEIAANESQGVELDGVIRQAGGVEGIVNGMDTTDWSPNVDKFLDVKYDADTVDEGKVLAKEALQAELGLPVDASVPLFGYIGRLEEQKGVDILLAALPKALQSSNIQVAILGTGKKEMEREIMMLEDQFPDAAKGIAEFSTPLAHQIIAGSDFLMIPSRFEPCGLVQLHAMQYGTVPLVATTGGLVDTVKDGVTGFHLGKMDTDKLLDSDAEAVAQGMIRAANAFSTPAFQEMRHKAIAQDLSWLKPARKWEAVLEGLLTGSSEAKDRGAAVRTPVQTPEHVARSEKTAALREEAKAAARSPREPENVDTSAVKSKPPAAAAAGTATSRAGPTVSSPSRTGPTVSSPSRAGPAASSPSRAAPAASSPTRAGPATRSPAQVPKSTAGARAPPSSASADGGGATAPTSAAAGRPAPTTGSKPGAPTSSPSPRSPTAQAQKATNGSRPKAGSSDAAKSSTSVGSAGSAVASSDSMRGLQTTMGSNHLEDLPMDAMHKAAAAQS
ncbi:hypothetical protein WJX82_008619 [Trebouxia sp. C0006]